MTEDNAPITITLKGGKEYDAPWLVLRGANPEQVTHMLNNLGDLPAAIAAQADLFRGTTAAGPALPQEQPQPQAAWGTVTQQGFQPAQQGQQWSQPAQQAPPQQQGPTFHPEGKQCPLDGQTLQYKEVFSKAKQKTFKFWTCPNQRNRDDGHTSEFAN